MEDCIEGRRRRGDGQGGRRVGGREEEV